VDAVARELLDAALQLGEAQAGGVWLRGERGSDPALVAGHAAGGLDPPAPRLPARALAAVDLDSALRAPPARGTMAEAALRLPSPSAALLVRFDHADDVEGALVIARLAPPDPFTPAEGRLVQATARIGAALLAGVGRRQALRHRTRETRAARRVAGAILTSLALEDVFRVTLTELSRVTSVDAAVLALVGGSDASGLVMMGRVGAPARTFAWSPDWRHAATGTAIRTHRAAIVADLRGSRRPVPPFVRELPEARGLLTLPLRLGPEPIGFLALASRLPGQFRARHLALLRPVADALAFAVHRARLLHATQSGLEERLQLQQRLARVERYATLGRVAGALAHEIRNPLTVIGTTIQYLRDQLPGGDERRALLEAADQKVREMDETLDSLVSVSRPLEIRLATGAVDEVLQEVAEFVRVRALQKEVEVQVEVEPVLLPVRLDRRLLGQALLNLALNALDATARGGRVTFGVRSADAGTLAVSVSDTGVGIPESELEAIFEPYFTTKRRGSGLGLAITRRIVEEHGGSIEAHSEPGRGSTFTITLPVVRRP
jgi:signal transduction histidine kinase